MSCRPVIVPILMAVGLTVPTLYAQSWESKALTGRKILCVTVEDSGKLVAGVEHKEMDGLYIANDATNTAMTAISFSLWVDPLSIVQVQPQLMFFVGYGQNESTGGTGDGIFKLQYVSQYTFTRMNTYASPTAITARVIKATPKDTIHVFLSNGARITHGRWKGYPPLTLDTLKSPANAFGTGQPFCAAMCVYGKDKRCYAGGYDKATTNPGTSDLLYEVRLDSMAVLKSSINVSSLAGSAYLYVGTKDDGIYRYLEPAVAGEAGAWIHAAGPVNAPIVAMVALPKSATEDYLYLAAGDGVYRGLSTLTGGWTKLGALPAAPTCLTSGKTYGEIFAGTANGVYRYLDDVVGTKAPRQNGPAASTSLRISAADGKRRLDIRLRSDLPADATISFHSANGRIEATGKVRSIVRLPAHATGPVFYRIDSGNRAVENGMIVLP